MKGPPEATERVLELLTGPYGLPKGSLRLPGSSERMKGPSKRLKRRNAVPCIFYTVLPWGPFKISGGGGQHDMFAPQLRDWGGGQLPLLPPSSAALGVVGSEKRYQVSITIFIHSFSGSRSHTCLSHYPNCCLLSYHYILHHICF